MKKFIFLSTYFLCSLNFIYGQCPTPKIVSPNGSETIIAGEMHKVEYYYTYDWDFDWDIYEIRDFIDFYYSLDDGETWEFVDSIAVDSTLAAADSLLNFDWQVPLETSDSCRIKLVKYYTNCWDESDNVFRINSSTSTSNFNISTIVLYPNPVQKGNKFSISNLENNISSVSLHDLYGQTIESFTPNSNGKIEIETAHLDVGLYILLFKREEMLMSRKVIIH